MSFMDMAHTLTGSLDSDSTTVVQLCGPSSTVTTPLDDVEEEVDDDDESIEAMEAGPQLPVAWFQLEHDVADGTWILTRFSSHCDTL